MILRYEVRPIDRKQSIKDWVYENLGFNIDTVDPVISIRRRNPVVATYSYFTALNKYFRLEAIGEAENLVLEKLYELKRSEFETELNRPLERIYNKWGTNL